MGVCYTTLVENVNDRAEVLFGQLGTRQVREAITEPII